MIALLMTILTGAMLGVEAALVIAEPRPVEVGCLVFVAAMFLLQLVVWKANNDHRR